MVTACIWFPPRAENGELLQANKSAISHWVNGTRRPADLTVQHLAEALSRRTGRTVTQAEIVATATELGRAAVERHHFLAVAALTAAGIAMPLDYDHEATSRILRARTQTSTVGEKHVEVVRQITAAFSAADERLGAGTG